MASCFYYSAPISFSHQILTNTVLKGAVFHVSKLTLTHWAWLTVLSNVNGTVFFIHAFTN